MDQHRKNVLTAKRQQLIGQIAAHRHGLGWGLRKIKALEIELDKLEKELFGPAPPNT